MSPRNSVRSGVVGQQKEIINGVEIKYSGEGHQYEFINNWGTDDFFEYLSVVNEIIIK